MARISKLLIVCLFAGIISGCEASQETSKPWIPVLEDTTFVYLSTPVSQALDATTKSLDALDEGDRGESKEALVRAMNLLLELHFYYLPMTEVRQLLYDADRLYYLREVDKAQGKLHGAKRVLVEMASADGPHFQETVNELIAMIDQLIVNIQESSPETLKKFEAVGDRANLMALKGQLILSDVEFNVDR